VVRVLAKLVGLLLIENDGEKILQKVEWERRWCKKIDEG
jgi:hypothetical protein